MTQLDSPSVSVQFEQLDRTTTRLKSYTIDSAYMVSTDAFSFTLYEEDHALVQNLELQPVSITIDGNLQVRGRIDSTEVGQGPGWTVKCEGRDYIADLVECNVDPALVVNQNMKLDQIVKLAAGPVGIAKVSYDASQWRNARTGVPVDTTNTPKPFKEKPLKDYKTNPGEGIYQFLSRICARSGCTLQPTMERDSVLLGAPDYVQAPAYSVTRSAENPTSTKNNVISAVARRNYSRFPTVMLVTGKAGAPGASRQTVSATSSSNGETLATTVPSNIQETIFALLPEDVTIVSSRILPKSNTVTTNALYRLVYMRDNLSKDLDQVMNVAARAAAERLKDALQYTITFRGHKDPTTGRTFATDTIIDVVDEVCNISEPLWVERVTFSYEQGAGPTTSLTCWRPGSFGIGAQE